MTVACRLSRSVLAWGGGGGCSIRACRPAARTLQNINVRGSKRGTLDRAGNIRCAIVTYALELIGVLSFLRRFCILVVRLGQSNTHRSPFCCAGCCFVVVVVVAVALTS